MSERRNSFWIGSGGFDGILAPILALVLIGLAIATYSQFSWTNNALSDLGIVPGATASLFNFGLILSGVLSLHFAVGLYQFLDKHIVGKFGAVIFAAASLSLDAIGWTPENIRPFHYIFSVMFFSLVPISLLVVASYFFITRQRRFAAFTFLIAVLAAAPWVLYFLVQYVPNVAIPELLSALAGSAWIIVVGLRMLKLGLKMQKTQSHPENS